MNGDYYNSEMVSRLIERYCDEHGITEADYAALVGLHPGSLSRIKAGKMCSQEVLAKVATLGKVSVRDLYNEAPEKARQEIFDAGRAKNLPVCV